MKNGQSQKQLMYFLRKKMLVIQNFKWRNNSLFDPKNKTWTMESTLSIPFEMEKTSRRTSAWQLVQVWLNPDLVAGEFLFFLIVGRCVFNPTCHFWKPQKLHEFWLVARDLIGFLLDLVPDDLAAVADYKNIYNKSHKNFHHVFLLVLLTRSHKNS